MRESGFTRLERGEISQTRAEGHPPICPRCETPLLLLREVAPRSDVAYVRVREWWQCPLCRRNVVLDPPRKRL